MTITYEIDDNVEPVAGDTVAQIASVTTYNVQSGCAATYNASNMEVVIAAGVVTHGGTTTTVAGDTVTLVSDPTHPRWAWIAADSGGAVDLVLGTAAETPAVPAIGDRVGLQLIKIDAGQTIADDCVAKLDKRVFGISTPSLQSSSQQYVESSGYKGYFALGAPAGLKVFASADLVGMGFTVFEDGTTADVSAGVGLTDHGGWRFSTGATNNEDAGVEGPPLYYTSDWTLVWRGFVPSAASQSWFLGAKPNQNFADENDVIGFRISGTGNITGVCDSGGTETTRDAGATGATECTLRIEVRSAGTIVRFYRNNVQIGADVTTNIPTSSALKLRNGIQANTADDKLAYTFDLFGWREV